MSSQLGMSANKAGTNQARPIQEFDDTMVQEITLTLEWCRYTYLRNDSFRFGKNTVTINEYNQDIVVRELTGNTRFRTTVDYATWKQAVMQANYYMVEDRLMLDWVPKSFEYIKNIQASYQTARNLWLSMLHQAPKEWLQRDMLDTPYSPSLGFQEETTVWWLHADLNLFGADYTQHKRLFRCHPDMSVPEILDQVGKTQKLGFAYEPERNICFDDERYGAAWRLWLICKTKPGWIDEVDIWIKPAVFRLYEKAEELILPCST